jgi:hypothetical protein
MIERVTTNSLKKQDERPNKWQIDVQNRRV